MKKAVIDHFKHHDPLLLTVFERLDLQLYPIELSPQPEELFFSNLCESIVGQQLSGKAADTIWGRFKALFPEEQVTPSAILATDDDTLRSVGLSRAKGVYVKALSQAVTDSELDLASLPNLSNEEIVTALTWVKGIGQWTAEIFMMFTLGREDIFSLGDLGLKNGLHRWYGEPGKSFTKEETLAMTGKWSPYRSYASKILWRSLELPIDRS